MYKMLGKNGRNYLSTGVGCLPSTVLTELAWASQISEPSTLHVSLICYSWPEIYQALAPSYCSGQLVLFLHTDQSHLFVPPIFDIFVWCLVSFTSIRFVAEITGSIFSLVKRRSDGEKYMSTFFQAMPHDCTLSPDSHLRAYGKSPPWNQHSTCKWMVGRRVSVREGLFWVAFAVSFSECRALFPGRDVAHEDERKLRDCSAEGDVSWSRRT